MEEGSRKGVRVSERDVTMRTGHYFVGFKMEEGGPKPRNIGSFWKLEKARKRIFPYSLQKGRQFYRHLI